MVSNKNPYLELEETLPESNSDKEMLLHTNGRIAIETMNNATKPIWVCRATKIPSTEKNKPKKKAVDNLPMREPCKIRSKIEANMKTTLKASLNAYFLLGKSGIFSFQSVL
jgi:hypothetical protein